MPELLAPGPGLDTRLLERFDWDRDGAPLVLANPEWVKRYPAAA
ncbi:MAG: hypothetical protein H6Q10_3268, partial [Acidobacteria bacterium]|nr:hypothetical protein [Acidobacteriota bacterium]